MLTHVRLVCFVELDVWCYSGRKCMDEIFFVFHPLY